ncbi:MAG TPA: EAL domain-containing protein, partial [Ruminiclostridium sp.]|nr:EAL domain-containing protein [Ruminiclostridium sp.]
PHNPMTSPIFSLMLLSLAVTRILDIWDRSFGSAGRALKWKEQQQQTTNLLAHLISDIWIKMGDEKEINYKAYHDTLTELPNRTMFTGRLNQVIHLAERSNKLVGVIFIDIDSFKAVNDSMGHNGGDSLLVQVGRTLRDSIRQYDCLARFGGDEFLVMVPHVDTADDIRSVTQRIMDSFQKPLTVKNQEFYMTASAGVAIYPIDGSTADDLIMNADLAMYISKEKGKNRYTVCSEDMKNEAVTNIILTKDLHKAIDNNELLLYFQPQVDTATEEIVGVESLVRWMHPEKGMIMPGVFIPLAEKSGLINQIGQWALLRACLQNKAWQDKGMKPIKMAVNLSLGQFLNSDLVKIVKNVLEITGLSPEYLELEITESLASYDLRYITAAIGRLKELGVDIAIDDFGSEYSSLSRLKILPVDKIKIDTRFIRGISENSQDEGIIKIILQLGKIFKIKVTAEGVETKEQAAFLKDNACDEIQGYYYYRPMPVDELENIIDVRKDSNQIG